MGDVQDGTYQAKAIAGSVQYGMTKTGTEQIAIDLDLLDIGEQVTTFLYFTDKSAKYSIARLRALGWKGDDLSDLTGIDSEIVEVSIKHEPFEGKVSMKVEILTGGGRVTLAQPMADKERRAFGASYKNLAASLRPAGAAPAAAPAPKKSATKPKSTPTPGGSGDAADDFPEGYNAPVAAAGGVRL